MIGGNVIRKLIPAVVPLYFLILLIEIKLDHTNIGLIMFLIPVLVTMYFAAANLLPIDDIAEKLEGRQRD